jgi:Xaa-Pro aminopeptidase
MKHTLPENSFFKAHREEFARTMAPNSIAVFMAGKPKVKTADQKYKFKQDSNFFYLTGVEVPKTALILNPEREEKKEILYIEKPNPKIEEWTGRRMRVDEAKELTGVEEIKFFDENLETDIFNLLHKIDNLYITYTPVPFNQPTTSEIQFINAIRERFPSVNIIRANNQLTLQRMRKSEKEVELIQKAINITKRGLEKVWEAAKPGMYEFELQAILEKEYLINRSERPGFNTIVASGENACVLHYETNECQIEDDALILIDTGAEYANYSADITRTFPANGKFTDRQKAVYTKVLETQKTIIEMVKPGISVKELIDKSKELLTQACKDLGLEEENDEEYMVYIKHGVGHFLGLDTHDVGMILWKDKPLQPGNIITVEPGLYISEEKIGIRIEDDVLVTDDGHKNLATDIPKEIDEIEKMMSQSRIFPTD